MFSYELIYKQKEETLDFSKFFRSRIDVSLRKIKNTFSTRIGCMFFKNAEIVHKHYKTSQIKLSL